MKPQNGDGNPGGDRSRSKAAVSKTAERLQSLMKSMTTRDAAQGLQYLTEHMVSVLLPLAVQLSGISENEFRERYLGISVVSRPIINARAFTNDSWKTFGIELYWGIFIFIYKMFKVFVSQVPTVNENGESPEGPTIPLTSLAHTVEGLLRSYRRGRILSTPGLWLKDLSDRQIALTAELVYIAELFVVGHELGHIVLELNPAARHLTLRRTGLPRETACDWTNEGNADILGLHFCLSRQAKRKSLSVVAAELFFIIEDMLDSFRGKTYGSCQCPSRHPPADFRRRVIRKFVAKSGLHQLLGAGKHLESLADSLLSLVAEGRRT